jgi:hypothetical protein
LAVVVKIKTLIKRVCSRHFVCPQPPVYPRPVSETVTRYGIKGNLGTEAGKLAARQRAYEVLFLCYRVITGNETTDLCGEI